MKVLVLFAGTRSIEKVFDNDKNIECRGVDIDPKFKPFYLCDLMMWEYQEVLNNWIPDYIHASPICKEFTQLKNGLNRPRDLGLGCSLMDKAIEIIEYVKHINPNLKFTIENPKSKFVKNYQPLNVYNRVLTSYCMYGYPYNKPTYFWYGGFNLTLRPPCRTTKNNTYWCKSKIDNKGKHKVRIGYCDEGQIRDMEYFRGLKQIPEYTGWNDTYLRYRIPTDLVRDIYSSLITN